MRAPKLTQMVSMGGMSRFRVMEAGIYAGQSFRVGDVVECRRHVSVGETIVLVAKGAGRPRFGKMTLEGLLGDGGEPCSPGRWQAIGAVVRVIPNCGDSTRHLRQTPPFRVMRRSLSRGSVDARNDTLQLRLFAA